MRHRWTMTYVLPLGSNQSYCRWTCSRCGTLVLHQEGVRPGTNVFYFGEPKGKFIIPTPRDCDKALVRRVIQS